MAKDSEVSLAQALNVFVDHLHLSAEALEALVDKIEGGDALDHRRNQDTIMEFGMIPPAIQNGDGGGDDFMYLEGSRLLMENSSIPIEMEGT